MSNKQGKGLSRRTFLQGTGVGIAGAGLFGISQDASAQEACETPSWMTAPDPIPDSEIIETIDADVVVVGAGMSGVTSALSAMENGANVVVIEKGRSYAARGLGIGVASSRLMSEQGIELDKDELARYWVQCTGSRAKESLIRLFLNESGNAMDWLLDKIEAADNGTTPILWGGYYKGPTFTEVPAYHMFFGGPRMMQEGRDPSADVTGLLLDEAEANGVTFYWQHPGEQLVKEGDRVVGVIASTPDGYKRFNASKGVVLATGDIGGNDEMCETLCPTALNTNMRMYYPIGQNTGDGHRMGMWAGGVVQEGPLPPMLHSQAFSMLQYHYLSVNCYGERL